MKYNPKVNEWAARLDGFARLHPLTPEHLAQGALELMVALCERMLAEIVGMDGVSLQPAAGAQGELTGLMMIRAYHRVAGTLAEEGVHPRQRPRHQPGELRAQRLRESSRSPRAAPASSSRRRSRARSKARATTSPG